MPKYKKKNNKKKIPRLLKEDDTYDGVFISQIQQDLLGPHKDYFGWYRETICSCLRCIVARTEGGKSFPKKRRLLRRAVYGLVETEPFLIGDKKTGRYTGFHNSGMLLSYFKPYIIPDILLQACCTQSHDEDLFKSLLFEYSYNRNYISKSLPSEEELVTRIKVRALCYLWYYRSTKVVLGDDLRRYIVGFII